MNTKDLYNNYWFMLVVSWILYLIIFNLLFWATGLLMVLVCWSPMPIPWFAWRMLMVYATGFTIYFAKCEKGGLKELMKEIKEKE